MSWYGVISGPYFSVFGPEITPHLDTSRNDLLKAFVKLKIIEK